MNKCSAASLMGKIIHLAVLREDFLHFVRYVMIVIVILTITVVVLSIYTMILFVLPYDLT